MILGNSVIIFVIAGAFLFDAEIKSRRGNLWGMVDSYFGIAGAALIYFTS